MQSDSLGLFNLLPYGEGIGMSQGISNSQPSITSSMNPNGMFFNKTPHNSSAMPFDSTLEMSASEPLTANMPSTFHNTFTQKPHFGSYMSGSLEPSTNTLQTPTSGFASYSAPAFGTSEHNCSSTSSSQSVSPSPVDCYSPYATRPTFQSSLSRTLVSASVLHQHTASRSSLTSTHMNSGLSSYQSFSPIGSQNEYLFPGIRPYVNITPEFYRSSVNSGHSISSVDEYLSIAAPAQLQSFLEPLPSTNAAAQTQDMVTTPYHAAPYMNGNLPIYRSTLPAYSNDVLLLSYDIATAATNASSASNGMTTTRSLSPLSSSSAPPSLISIRQRISPPRKRARCSTSKAKPSLVKHATSKNLPCTVSGCHLRFFDMRSRNRHIGSMHERKVRSYCPGDCKERGFSREDALKRHLDWCEVDSKCVIEARKLGWSPDVKGSVVHLRGYVTSQT